MCSRRFIVPTAYSKPWLEIFEAHNDSGRIIHQLNLIDSAINSDWWLVAFLTSAIKDKDLGLDQIMPYQTSFIFRPPCRRAIPMSIDLKALQAADTLYRR